MNRSTRLAQAAIAALLDFSQRPRPDFQRNAAESLRKLAANIEAGGQPELEDVMAATERWSQGN